MMTRRINYEDDIFTVALQLRCLQDTLKLDVDPEIFKERILGDIAWIDATIAHLYQGLQESSLYVKRQDYLRELQKVKRAFVDAVDVLVEKRAAFAEHVVESTPDLRSRRDANIRDIEAIGAVLAGAGSPDEAHIVSAEELRFLMTEEDEDAQ